MSKKRMKVRDASFTFRMGAGFAGEVNRTHPADIVPELIDSAASTPPTAYGQVVILDTVNSAVRPFAAGDTAVTTAYGMTVRPYPTQQASASNFGQADLGAATPPTSGVIDVLRRGYIMAKVTGTVAKGGAVYVWCAASSGNHVQGQLESGATGGSTAALTNLTFNGSADANGVVEVIFNN